MKTPHFIVNTFLDAAAITLVCLFVAAPITIVLSWLARAVFELIHLACA